MKKFRSITAKFLLVTVFIALGLGVKITAASAGQKPVAKVRTVPSFVPNEIIVKYRPGYGNKGLPSKKNQFGVRTLKKHLKSGIDLMGIDNTSNVNNVVYQLNNDPGVLYAQPNYIYYPQALSGDPGSGDLWGLQNVGQTVNGGTPGKPGVDIDISDAWSITTGNPAVVVAVIDTGVDISHPDIAANIWTNPGEIPANGLDDDHNGYIDDVHGWDFLNNDNTVYDIDSFYDEDEHGTHVAGIIGAVANNGLGVAGVAPNVKIMPVKFMGKNGGTSADAIAAIEYAAAEGVQISNNSWGGAASSGDLALKDAINASGQIFIAAAGNSHQNNNLHPDSPSGLDSPNIVAVTAVNNQGQLADFANYGLTSVDVAGPGVDILSLKPGSAYQYMSGTSMASPYVAGTAALMLSVNPSITPSKVCELLKRTVKPLSALSGYTVSGGMVNAYTATVAAKIPDAPAGLIVSPGNGEVQLSWVAVADGDLAGYNIYRNNNRLNAQPVVGNSFTAPGLLGGTVYSFKVSAVDQYGFESPSSISVDKQTYRVTPVLSVAGKSKAKNGDSMLFGGMVTGGCSITTAKLELLNGVGQVIEFIDIPSGLEINQGVISGGTVLPAYSEESGSIRLNLRIGFDGTEYSVVSNLIPLDNKLPEVYKMTPPAGGTGVPVNNPGIAVSFTEPLQTATVNNTNFSMTSVADGSEQVIVSSNLSGVVITPVNSLKYATKYTITVSNKVYDLAGNAVTGAPLSWEFTTENDTYPPELIAPTSAVNVPVSGNILFQFNEDVAYSSVVDAINRNLVFLTSASGVVAAAVSFDQNTKTLVITPVGSLWNKVAYTVSISGISDLSGNKISIPQTWSFTTVDSVTNDQENTIAGGGGGPGGGVATAPEPATPKGVTVAQKVNSDGDTLVQNTAGTVSLNVPLGAIGVNSGASVMVSITELQGTQAKDLLKTANRPSGFSYVGKIFEFKAEVTQEGNSSLVTSFAKPLTLTIQLDNGELEGITDPNKVGLFRLNDDGTMTFVGGKIANGSLVVEMYGFSRYVLGEVNLSFNDLAGHWAKKDIELMASKYVVKGYPDGGFSPEGKVSRAEFVAMLVKAIGLQPSKAPLYFKDVKSSDWDYGTLQTAVKAGLISGFSDDSFKPDAPVTREQIATMIAQALTVRGEGVTMTDEQVTKTLEEYTDGVQASGWARKNLAAAVHAGIIHGTTSGTIAPVLTAARAEAAVMIARLWGK